MTRSVASRVPGRPRHSGQIWRPWRLTPAPPARPPAATSRSSAAIQAGRPPQLLLLGLQPLSPPPIHHHLGALQNWLAQIAERQVCACCWLLLLHWQCCKMEFGRGSIEAQGRLRSRKFKSGRLPQFQDRRTNWCICNGLPCGRVFCTRLHGLAHESGRRQLKPRATTKAPNDGVGGAAGVWRGVCALILCTILCHERGSNVSYVCMVRSVHTELHSKIV